MAGQSSSQVSKHHSWHLATRAKAYDVTFTVQNHYSLVYREEEREMNKYCRETGVGIIPWGPLHAGMLARPIGGHKSTDRSQNKADATTQETAIVGRVEEIAKKRGWSMGNVVSLQSRTLFSRTLCSRTLCSRTLFSRTLFSQ